MSDRLEAAVAELVAALRAEVEADARPADAPDRLLSIPEASQALGVGRTLVYSLIQSGALKSVKCGRRRLVSSSAIRDYAEAGR